MTEQATGGTDLRSLLAELDPWLDPHVHVFVTVPRGSRPDAAPVAVVEEDEGTTLVLHEEDAQRLGLAADHRSARITLRVHSALAAVGLLARVTSALAAHGISANPVAGFHHDHLFVPHDRSAEAMRVLVGLRHGAASRRIQVGEYELDDDRARVDRRVVWEFLSTQAYWSRWRTRAEVETQIDVAWRVIGVYHRATGEMVGFARAVSDGVSFAYLADVFVLPPPAGTG